MELTLSGKLPKHIRDKKANKDYEEGVKAFRVHFG